MSYGRAVESSRAEILKNIIASRERDEEEALIALNHTRAEVQEATTLSEALKLKLDEADQK